MEADGLEEDLDVGERMLDSRAERGQEGVLVIEGAQVVHPQDLVEVLRALKVAEVLQVLQEGAISSVEAFLAQVEDHHEL